MRTSFTRLLNRILLVLVMLGFCLVKSYGQEFKNGVQQGVIRIKIKPEVATTMNVSLSLIHI